MRSQFGPGALAAVATLALDQASKFWLLHVFDIAHRGAVRVTPFFDLVLAWNIGISFGWFQNDNPIAQTSLMVVKALAVIAPPMIIPSEMVASIVLERDIQIASAITASAFTSIRPVWAMGLSFWNQPKLIPIFQASTRSKNGVMATVPR